jgi:uncharacterized protein involved in cysteine biosynthesis
VEAAAWSEGGGLVGTKVPRARGFGFGFFAGVGALFRGVAFVVGTPSVWPWAMIPVFVATALFGGATALSVWGGNALVAWAIHDQGTAPSFLASLGLWTLHILAWTVGVILAFFVAMSLAQPLSGFALEAVARRQEVARGGRHWPDQGFFSSAARSLRVSLTALAIGLPILGALAVVTFLFPPSAVVTIPLKFVVTGLLAAYDLLDYPLSVRGHSVGDRMVFIRHNFGEVLGFGVATAALLLVPGMALFLLPFGVAGATSMVVSADGDAPDR